MQKLLFTGGTGFLGRNIKPILDRSYDVTAQSFVWRVGGFDSASVGQEQAYLYSLLDGEVSGSGG